MAEEKKYVKKIKLSDNRVLYVCDSEAARQTALAEYLPLTGGTIAGELDIDNICKVNQLYILETEYIEYSPVNVLCQDDITGKIYKRSIDELLNDAGGISYSMDESTGTLSFKFGKQ